MNRRKNQEMSSPLFVLDESFYPETWKLDTIMSLYIDEFEPCRLNSNHNYQKLRFWKDLIDGYCYYKGSAKVNITELKQVFKRKGIFPRCLQTVVSQMIIEGNLVDKEGFMQEPQTLASWAINTAFVQPLFWSAGKIKNAFVRNTNDEQKLFIFNSVVSHQSEVLLEYLRNNHSPNEIITMETLIKDVDNIKIISRDGLDIVLHHLRKHNQSIYIDEVPEAQRNQQKLLLKVCPSSQQVQPITESERSVCNLEETQKLLLENLRDKENKMNETLEQVKIYLRDGKKQLAKSLLRKKHLFEADLTRIESVLGNVQTILHQINASTSDQEILKTYKIVSEAMKTTFADSVTSLDHVHSIIDDIQEMFHQQEQISDALKVSFDRVNDDSELEDELMALISTSEKSGNEKWASGDKKIVDDKSFKSEKAQNRSVKSKALLV